jgi:hypothetical protein
MGKALSFVNALLGKKYHEAALAVIGAVYHDVPGMLLKNEDILKNFEEILNRNKMAAAGYNLFLVMFNLVPLLWRGKTFLGLKAEARHEFLKGLVSSRFFVSRMIGVIASFPFKFGYVCSEEVHSSLNVPFRKERSCPEPEPRWMRQITPASGFETDEAIEADVVVVGTGAGGAVVAKELAEKGYAVAIIEAGEFYRRESFTGNPLDMVPMLYKSQGITGTVGNAVIPIQRGNAVGGTTLINSATCFRTPEEVLNEWVGMGLSDFTPQAMAPYFERVEKTISVQECEAKYIGPIGEVIRDGCAHFGYSCRPLKHNIIDCDGQGVCTQGCPKDAKQSTNLTYIPRALNAAAQLFTGFEATEILTRGERATGIKAVGTGKNGRKVTLTCTARAVILSCGAFVSPLLIQKNRLTRGNRWVGKNLTIHPCVFVGGMFPDRVMRNSESIPQGYMIDQFDKKGLRFEGGTPPLMVFSSIMPGIGKEYIEWVASYDHVGIFGCMVKDTSTGFVKLGPAGIPLVYYSLSKRDTQSLIESIHILGDVYFAAGASKIFLPVFNDPIINDTRDLKNIYSRNLKPRDLILCAFHAAGTTRIGLSSSNSVLDTGHQCHRVPGLFVVDGSSIPTSLGVNPMETIMAMATRAADKIAPILDR